jgi:hypothetical protein
MKSVFWTSCLLLVVKGPKGWIQLIVLLTAGFVIGLLVLAHLKKLAEPFIEKRRQILAATSRAKSFFQS